MKSLYAVLSQIILSGSNYLVFLIFLKYLPNTEFIAFSTAVGLNIIAYAIAEGGISYVAPREITSNPANKTKLISSFITICILLYIISLMIGFFLWNIFSSDNLNIVWVIAYAIYFLPVLIIPSWVTCWSVNLDGFIAIGIAKGITIILIFLYPNIVSLTICGLFFLIFTLGFLSWLNRKELLLGIPNKQIIGFAVNSLLEVFLSKTSSYAAYSVTPLFVSSIYGNSIASLYIVGERLKAMYSTLFQPLIQTMYLWQFQTKKKIIHNNIIILTLILLNIITTIISIIAIKIGLLNLFSERFSSIKNLSLYIIASFLSVTTASLLYFNVLPSGNFKIFRNSTYVQLATFLTLFGLMSINPILLPEYVLLLGELSILLAILMQILLNSKHPFDKLQD